MPSTLRYPDLYVVPAEAMTKRKEKGMKERKKKE
jgi:hypothetical protein